MLRVIVELGLKLFSSLGVLALGPEQVAQAEVNIGLSGIGLHGGAQLADRPLLVLHLIQGFADQHVGFSGLRIERHDLVKRIEHARILTR